MRGKIHENLAHARGANAIGPCERTDGIVDAFLHREIDVVRRCNALRHCVCGFVREHDDSSHHREPGNVVQC